MGSCWYCGGTLRSPKQGEFHWPFRELVRWCEPCGACLPGPETSLNEWRHLAIQGWQFLHGLFGLFSYLVREGSIDLAALPAPEREAVETVGWSLRGAGTLGVTPWAPWEARLKTAAVAAENEEWERGTSPEGVDEKFH